MDRWVRSGPGSVLGLLASPPILVGFHPNRILGRLMSRGLSSPSSSVSLNGELLLEEDLCFSEEDPDERESDRAFPTVACLDPSPLAALESAELAERVSELVYDCEDSQVRLRGCFLRRFQRSLFHRLGWWFMVLRGSSKLFMYKFLCWNIRGLNDPCKKAAVKDVVLENGVNLVCLQETKMETFTSNNLRGIGNGRLSEFVFKASEGASGGIMLARNDRRWKKVDEREEKGPVLAKRYVFGRNGDKVWKTILFLEDKCGKIVRKNVFRRKYGFTETEKEASLARWNISHNGLRRQNSKRAIEEELRVLEDREESIPLSKEDRLGRASLKSSWFQWLRTEEAEWRERSRETWLKEGDNITKFFHKVANMRRRINHIRAMQSGDQVLEAQEDIEQLLVSHFTSAYKKDRHHIAVWVDEDLKKVPDHLWTELEAPFSADEVKKAVFGATSDKAPGPDGFGLRFF
ncbi:hypothetical protein QJS10_CPB14g01222 [Acorus calamus]|uniref:Endonuclease/exonuclease/phosphatase domain-containing protein n=1 Tax=Acorus calamus TaxID=4465 RepID=A0AAV9D9S4_ACOCL|nr:hypothetical protein QJS10_CPB14g01222 [Acorus calamus]